MMNTVVLYSLNSDGEVKIMVLLIEPWRYFGQMPHLALYYQSQSLILFNIMNLNI